jgi:transketolase
MDKKLQKRLLELLYKNNEEHIGSCFSGLEIIDNIFKTKSKDDKFILSCGHLGFALYTVIEKYYPHINAQDLVNKHGGHPHMDIPNHIYCSTGSLGLGITIAVGMALADKTNKIHVLISDGECAEGSIWESLRYIKEYNVDNIVIHCNINGYAGYDALDSNYLIKRLKAFLPEIVIHKTNSSVFPFLKGIGAHYYKMNGMDYKEALKLIK